MRTLLILGRIGFDSTLIEPHVGHSHSILGQCSRFIRADGRGGTERFDSFQIFDQTVLLRHSLRR